MGITVGSDIRGRGPGGEVVLEDGGHTLGKHVSGALVCRGFIGEYSVRVLASCAHVGAIVYSRVAGFVASGLFTAMSCPSVNVRRDPRASHSYQGLELSGLPVVGAMAPT